MFSYVIIFSMLIVFICCTVFGYHTFKKDPDLGSVAFMFGLVFLVGFGMSILDLWNSPYVRYDRCMKYVNDQAVCVKEMEIKK